MPASRTSQTPSSPQSVSNPTPSPKVLTVAAASSKAKKTATKKAPTKKKAAAKKPATKKAPVKKAAAKKAATKKASAKKAPAKKAATKKSAAKKASAAKAAAPKTRAKKSTPTKAATKSSPSKKAKAKLTSTASADDKKTKKVVLPDYLTDAKWLASQRDILVAERARYTKSAKSLADEAAQLMADREPGDVQFDEESGEGDTIAVERDRDLALSAKARESVDEIDAAFKRLDDGTYGICTKGDGDDFIPKERLEAIPEASICVQHKTAMF